MDCYTLHGMNVLYEEARKCYVNTSTSKAQGVRITPEYVGPLPSTKRERHPRKCKKEAFNYKTNTSLPRSDAVPRSDALHRRATHADRVPNSPADSRDFKSKFEWPYYDVSPCGFPLVRSVTDGQTVNVITNITD